MAKVDEDDCCCAIGNGDDGHAGVAKPELGGDKAVVERMGVCRIMRSNGSTTVSWEDGVLGGSPAGVKVW